MSRILSATIQLEDDVAKANTFVHGDEEATYTAKDGTKVRSIRNLQREAEVNVDVAKTEAARSTDAANKAESAATTAQTSAKLYPDIQEGMASTNEGEFFSVVAEEDSNYISLYKKELDQAVFIKSYPSSVEVINAKKQSYQQVSGLARQVSFAPASSFDDGQFEHVDKSGISLNGKRFLENISKSSGSLKYAPYQSFDDEKVYLNCDAKLNPLYPESTVNSQVTQWEKEIYVDYKKEGRILNIAWRHNEGLMLQMTWGENGHNGLFNFISIKKAIIGNPETANWEDIQTVKTDYIPPLYFKALTGDTSDSGTSSTGGNHGTNGGQGEKTAFMDRCDVYIDNIIAMGDFSGYLTSVIVRWENHLYAGNTVNEKRVCLIQRLMAKFEACGVTFDCECEAQEKIEVSMDGGPQVVGAGWNDSVHFYGGKNKGPQTGTATTIMQAGLKTEAPYCWATVLKDKELGYLAAWIDRSYGVKSDWVGDNNQMAFKNNNSWKFYQCAVRATDKPITMKPKEKYRWRGGYSYSPISIVDGIDSAFLFKRGNKLKIGYAALEGEQGVIFLPKTYAGTDFGIYKSILGTLEIGSAGYKTGIVSEE